MAGIYIIANDKSGKAYIGSTMDFRKRWRNHRSCLCQGVHGNPHLQAAWNKYGEATFEFGVLEYLDNPEELHLAEQFWMDIYREEGKELYNFGSAARHPMLGMHHTEETKHRLSEASKSCSEETRQRISKTLRGRRLSEETKRKISKSQAGRKHTKETKRKIGRASKGKCPSEETRRKISEANARPYPAFIHRGTGEIIPAGVNLVALCRELELNAVAMCAVKTGRCLHHRGWILLEEM